MRLHVAEYQRPGVGDLEQQIYHRVRRDARRGGRHGQTGNPSAYGSLAQITEPSQPELAGAGTRHDRPADADQGGNIRGNRGLDFFAQWIGSPALVALLWWLILRSV